MTEIRLTRNGATHHLRTDKPWDQVLDSVGRAFYPDGPHIGGPALPKLEKPQGRARR